MPNPVSDIAVSKSAPHSEIDTKYYQYKLTLKSLNKGNQSNMT
jgi:hypothetical protein